MYALIQNNSVQKFPYSPNDLREDNKNVSFPEKMSDALLESWGVFKVTTLARPDVSNDSFAEQKQNPEFVDSKWVLGWEVKTKTQEQIQQETNAASEKARKIRDNLLSECDWVVIKCFESSQSIPSQWASYRQALRDVPQQNGFPSNIVWPVKPE